MLCKAKPPDPGLSPRAVLDAFVENMPSEAAQPVLHAGGDEADMGYQVVSSGINRALGRETAVYRGSHRHPDWPPEVWKVLPPPERRGLSQEFF